MLGEDCDKVIWEAVRYGHVVLVKLLLASKKVKDVGEVLLKAA